ncbi:MAG TPA: transglutaminase domain-containing protein [candidate division Zixibacteria bacterium]|nr:transglutaminase domain-containing protein [candidate division Zixibacteria bacterium]
MTYSKFINSNDAIDIIVEGMAKDGKYSVVVDVAGQKSTKVFPLPVEKLSDVLKVEIMATEGKLKSGNKYEIYSFDAEPPMTDRFKHILTVHDQKQLVFNGVPTEVFIVRDSIPAIGIESLINVDINGNILEESVEQMDMVMKLEPEDLAKKLDTGFDLLANNIIPAKNGPDNPRDIDSAVYIISSYDIASIPDSDWLTIKSFSPDSAEITVKRITYNQVDQEIPIDDKEFNIYMMPEPLIQSDNQAITELADKIIGDESNALKAAQLINDWVFKNIKKEFSPDISNALQTLNTGRGDCGEHAALAVALLRASGIPSRIAAGIAYWPDGEGFAFHAWTEVYIGLWIQMDPTWGDTFADATHIMLARGGLKNQIGPVINALVSLEIQFVSYK